MLSRRAALSGAVLLAAGATLPCSAAGSGDPAALLEALEKSSGGRLGVTILNTESGSRIDRRSDERFPMCSTFKHLAAAAVLARVDRGEERLDSLVSYGPADLLEYAPVTRERVASGAMSLKDLCDAAITMSDNTAANLILDTIGGPSGLTAYLRSVGDPVTRLDRVEPTLNEAVPGDERDTTTPAAMVGTMSALLLGKALSMSSRDRLTGWLVANKTSNRGIRPGLPKNWRSGDKTGSGANGTSNDVAIVWPTGRSPILVAAYLTGATVPPDARLAVLADVGRVVAMGV